MKLFLIVLLAVSAKADAIKTHDITEPTGYELDTLLNVPTKNIVQLAQSVTDLSTLVQAVVAGKLATTLSGKGPFTVFAPTNEAFAALPNGTLAKLLAPANIKDLVALLEYHVLAGAVYSKDLKAYQMVKTLEGDKLDIQVAGGKVFVNNAQVTGADNAATNGVVHIINAVLTIPSDVKPTNVVQVAQSVKDLSTLVSAVVAGKLVETLSGKGPFTVFAPTNEAFAALPNGTLAHLLDPKNIKELDALLAYHVIPGAAVYSKDLKAFQVVKTLQGDKLEIQEADGDVFVNNAPVTVADIAASNGVIHMIDSVLTPTNITTRNIVQVAQSVKDLSTLVTALVAGNLTHALSGKGPFTVFAPTNEAFAALPNGTLAHLLDPKNIKELDALLAYHVIPGAAVYSKDLTSSQMVESLEGDELDIQTKTGGVVFVNNAQVTVADIAASNGVIHMIDSVLTLPSSGSSDGLSTGTIIIIIACVLAVVLLAAGGFYWYKRTQSSPVVENAYYDVESSRSGQGQKLINDAGK